MFIDVSVKTNNEFKIWHEKRQRIYKRRTGQAHVSFWLHWGSPKPRRPFYQDWLLALFSLRTESDNPDATCELSP